ncbi:MAG: hypothetical protein KDA61_07310, partial [Planctomycetales bacterium]|nr:hypothetical protein [Planctomycetales bacterium]
MKTFAISRHTWDSLTMLVAVAIAAWHSQAALAQNTNADEVADAHEGRVVQISPEVDVEIPIVETADESVVAEVDVDEVFSS